MNKTNTAIMLEERIRRMSKLLLAGAEYLDRYMPDLCGLRNVMTGQMRDAADNKWDDGEWEMDDGSPSPIQLNKNE